MVSEEVATADRVSLQYVTEEVIVKDDVSILGRKRKCSDDSGIDKNDIFSEVSRSPIRARTNSSHKKVHMDHTLFKISS